MTCLRERDRISVLTEWMMLTRSPTALNRVPGEQSLPPSAVHFAYAINDLVTSGAAARV